VTGPTFEVGQVVEYEYLWAREAQCGRDHGRKDRPCAIVFAVIGRDDAPRIFLAPITHEPPRKAGDAVAFPPATKKRLGLDDEPSWIVVTELNATRLPAPELRPTPEGAWSYGFLPEPLFKRLFAAIKLRADEDRLTIIDRDA
jgi:hypothetical protein